MLCFSDTGNIGLETICLPCSGETEEVCEVDLPDDLHNKHGDCYYCLDVEFDGPIWSERVINRNLYHLTNFVSVSIDDSNRGLTSIANRDPQITKLNLAYGQNPSSYSIATAILRC